MRFTMCCIYGFFGFLGGAGVAGLFGVSPWWVPPVMGGIAGVVFAMSFTDPRF